MGYNETETLEGLKSWRKKGLSAECKREIEKGFEHNGYRFDCYTTDQLNYNSMLNLTSEDDSDTVDCDVDLIGTGARVTIQMNHSEILAMSKAAAAHIYQLRSRLKMAKLSIDEATEPNQVNEVRF